MELSGTPGLFTVSSAALGASKTGVRPKTEYISIRFHSFHERVATRGIVSERVSPLNNVADFGAEPLQKFGEFFVLNFEANAQHGNWSFRNIFSVFSLGLQDCE